MRSDEGSPESRSRGRISRCGRPGVRSVIERSFQPMRGSCAANQVMPRMASYDSSEVAVKQASKGIGDPFAASSEQVAVVRPAALAMDPSARRIVRSEASSCKPQRRANSVSMNTSEAPLSRRIVAATPLNQPRSLKRRQSGVRTPWSSRGGRSVGAAAEGRGSVSAAAEVGRVGAPNCEFEAGLVEAISAGRVVDAMSAESGICDDPCERGCCCGEGASDCESGSGCECGCDAMAAMRAGASSWRCPLDAWS